ncbi:MAG: DUF2126 domain-containing protein [Solirubrobacteraceae bacterium]
MSIRVALEHRTVYRYDRPVRLGPQSIRLRPAPHTRTPILAYSLKVEPADHFVNWQQDPFGNYLARLVFPEPTTEFSVTVDLIADMTVINPFDFFVEEEAKEWPFAYEPGLAYDLAPYLDVDQPDPVLSNWLADIPRQPMGTIDALIDVNQRVNAAVSYSVRMEPGVLSPAETLTRAVGSCRDSAWLLVHTLRHLGIAARFASGYLVQLAEDQPPLEGAAVSNDFTDLHAWAEAYVPGAGWVGLDATSGLLTGEGHIPLSCTPSPEASAPIAGAVEPAEVTFEFSNTVTRSEERPRVTLPYTEEQWAAIDALGRQVDAQLDTGDVRLTMGGEPTFVAAGDMEADEWNTDAMGPTKHGLAVDLALRLADRFAPGALIQHGQGKWYPGEPLPRWEVRVRWRTDGVPLWRDRALLAHPTREAAPSTTADARALTEAITDALGLQPAAAVPAYEDEAERLLREAREPGGDPPELDDPDPEDPRLADQAARTAFVAELDADRGDPVGWALPLHRGVGDEAWRTGSWNLRRGHLFLIPGDSPIGLRLPLDALTWTPPVPDPEPSRFATLGALDREPRAAAVEEIEPPPITAVCVEVRDGHVHVFLPPLDDLAHAAELLRIVEDAAAATGTPVVLEGYAPPSGGGRAQSFSVTPDPGVIEVNIHPSSTWGELVEKADVLHEEARRIGLASEKFALDGMHTGTGGGAHLTCGGTTPKDSPFLRRPDLLRSLLTYWQHHPSLSYLFSGRFVGPTSQAPRVDEARHENLYELEIAFNEMARLAEEDEDGAPVPAWTVDRLLRNLLTDLTGNTHRAEFCIDKLYDPGTESGRLGIVELRGFEMPPHPQMGLVQSLLVRALIARFWEQPYTGPLVRWGTELHDRFLLPWFCEQDIRAVVGELDGFDHAWLDPFLEFRFPHLGTAHVDGVDIELRMAIEPWHVLGEEAGAGTARYVDSSLERLQVRVDGMVGERHVLTCNGHRVPLQRTGVAGSYVGGVRYCAWQPWSALHPTIAVHSPLVFDVLDRWTERSMGGCVYHVVHPGGRSYDTFPVNASEAQSRRSNRFEAAGHTPGPVTVPPAVAPGEYPRTLDLRRPAQR